MALVREMPPLLVESKRLLEGNEYLANRSVSNTSFHQKIRRILSCPVALDWEIDDISPLFPGSTLFGRIIVNVLAEEVEIDHFDAATSLYKTQKQPCRKHCATCKHQNTDLHSWTFTTGPIVLRRGKTEFPFSAPIPDDAPPSLNTPHLAIAHGFRAPAYISRVDSTPSANTELPVVVLRRVFSVQSCDCRPILPQYLSHSVPRTDISATTIFDPVIHPSTPTHVSIEFNGLVGFGAHGKDSQIWRLTQAAWSIEETVRTVPNPCRKHIFGNDPDERRIKTRTKVQRLGGKELYEGWKLSDKDFSLQLDFDLGFKPNHKIHSRASFPSNLETPGSFGVSHLLIVDLLFVLEHFPDGDPRLGVRTGIVRTARLSYPINVVNGFKECLESCDESLASYEKFPLQPPEYEEDLGISL